MAERKVSYAEQLKDPRWQKKRLEVLNDREWMCETCQETTKTLHVHHGYYEKGLMAWEYSNASLQVLCEDCHADVQEQLAILNRATGHMHLAYIYPWEVIGFIQGLMIALHYDRSVHVENNLHASGIGYAFGVCPGLVMVLKDENGNIKGDALYSAIENGHELAVSIMDMKARYRHHDTESGPE